MKKVKNLKQALSILSIALILTSSSAISGCLVQMKEDLGITRPMAEFIVTVTALSAVIFIFLSNSITARIGMKNSVLLGLMLVFFSGLLPLIFRKLYVIIFSRLLLGAGLGIFNGHSATYINLFYKQEERTYLQGMRNSAEFIGQMAFFLLAGLLIKINRIYSFSVYCSALIIWYFFRKNVPDIDYRPKKIGKGGSLPGPYRIFFAYAFVIIMNITSFTVRFPSLVYKSMGKGANTSFYLTLIPITGMVASSLFGAAYKLFKDKTVFIAMIGYILVNLLAAKMENSVTGFLICALIAVVSQSLSIPFILDKIPIFLDEDSLSLGTNLIFLACNLGSFAAPFFSNFVDKLIRTDLLTGSFPAFSIIYLIIFPLLHKSLKLKKIKAYR